MVSEVVKLVVKPKLRLHVAGLDACTRGGRPGDVEHDLSHVSQVLAFAELVAGDVLHFLDCFFKLLDIKLPQLLVDFFLAARELVDALAEVFELLYDVLPSSALAGLAV